MTEQVTGHIDPAGIKTLQTIAKANHFNEWMYDTIQPFLKGDILEIGSGIGNISAFVLRDQFSLTLSDINPEYQGYLQKKFTGQAKEIIAIDLQHPSFANEYYLLKEKYDSIFLLNVIEHLADDRAAIENCRFLLKKDGQLIVLAPAYSWLYCGFDKELGHYRRYTAKNLSAIFSTDQFSVLKKQYFNFCGIGGWLLFGKLLRKKLIGGSEMSAFNKLVPLFKLADRIIFNKAGLSAIVAARKK
jgi:2-polyprenyl-3-methyl-5-hydroxy-6-metoxy-1,4-benzoquinol methylase